MGRGRAGERRLAAGGDARPCCAGVAGAEQAPAQAGHEQRAGLGAERGEPRASVGRFERAPCCAGVAGAVERAGLAGEIEAPRAVGGDGVEVKIVGVVRVRVAAGGAAQERRGFALAVGAAVAARPRFAAVFGGEVQAERADGGARAGAGEIYVQQGDVPVGRVMQEFPGFAAVGGAEDRGVVTHRPARARVVHMHGGEHGARGNLRLRPGFAAVIGEEGVAAFADDDEAFAGGRAVEQEGARGERRFFRRRRRLRPRGGGRGGNRGGYRGGEKRARRGVQRRPSRRSAAGVKSREVTAASHEHMGYSLSSPSAR